MTLLSLLSVAFASTCDVDNTGTHAGSFPDIPSAVVAGCTDIHIACPAGSCTYSGTVNATGLPYLNLSSHDPGTVTIDGGWNPAIESFGVPVELHGIDALASSLGSVVYLEDADFLMVGDPGFYAYITTSPPASHTSITGTTGIEASGDSVVLLDGIVIENHDVGVVLDIKSDSSPALEAIAPRLSGNELGIEVSGCTTCGTADILLRPRLIAKGDPTDAQVYIMENNRVLDAQAPANVQIQHALILRNMRPSSPASCGRHMVAVGHGSHVLLENVLVTDNDADWNVDTGFSCGGILFAFEQGTSDIEVLFSTIAHNQQQVGWHWTSSADPRASASLDRSHVAFNDKVFSHSSMSGSSCGTMNISDTTFWNNYWTEISWPLSCAIPFHSQSHQLYRIAPDPAVLSSGFQPLPAGLEPLVLVQGHAWALSRRPLPRWLFPGMAWTVDNNGPDTGRADLGFHGI